MQAVRMPKVTVIPAKKDLPLYALSTEAQAKLLRVAAYARVSTDSAEQLTSYRAQVDYYTRYIAGHDGWELVEVYTDEGISGTTIRKREGFQRMIADALAGKIDLIVTKSLSRFARNTVDTLTTVRALKEKGVGVFFEKENIHTLDSKGELLITIMSSLAQEESRSISENVTWGHRKRFADGKIMLAYKNFLGYRKGPDGLPEIVEEEAKIVRQIYRMFLCGKAPNAIARYLTEAGISTPGGKITWRAKVVESILTNEKYKGDALLQKSVTVDYLQKKIKPNEGEAQQYYVEGSHPAIIQPELFDLVQYEMKRRKADAIQSFSTHPFTSKLFCGECGGRYGSMVEHTTDKYRRAVWVCGNKRYHGLKCKTERLLDSEIQTAFLEAFNRILGRRTQIMDAYHEVLGVLTDTTALDATLARLSEESEVVAAMIQKAVDENASTVQDQQEYERKYTALCERYMDTKRQLDELSDQRAERLAKRTKITMFLEELHAQKDFVTEFDEELWYMTVDRVDVYAQMRLIFTFKDGSTVEVQAQKAAPRSLTTV